MGLTKYSKPVLFTRLRFGCFLLLSIAALAPFGLRGACLKADQEASKSTVTVKPGDYDPGVAIHEALMLAEQYLAENHVDTSQHFLQSVEIIYVENIRQWRVLWQRKVIVDGPPLLGVYVKMDRSVSLIGRQSRGNVPTLKEMQQLPTSRPAEATALQGKLTLADGSPVPGVLITLESRSALWQTVTTENGTFRIPRIAPGDYLFKSSLPGFSTMYRLLHLRGGEIRQLDLQQDVLPIIGEDVFDKKPLRGNVYINKRIPFPGVKVTATAKDFSQTVITMNNGEFRFFGLEKDGTYILRFSAEGFQDIIATCMVGPGTRTKTEIHFIIPWLCELPDPAGNHLEAQKTETFSFDWQTKEKDIGTVLSEKYMRDIIVFERQEIAALIPVEKIDLYMEYFEQGLKTDIGITIIEGGEYRWLETAESLGSQYRRVFKRGYYQGSLNATLEKKAGWKAEWQTFIKEWLKWIGATERSKVEALLPKKKVDAYMNSFTLGLNSDTGISKKNVKRHAWLEAAFHFGFHYQRLFENGYREGLVQSAGDPMKYMKRID